MKPNKTLDDIKNSFDFLFSKNLSVNHDQWSKFHDNVEPYDYVYEFSYNLSDNILFIKLYKKEEMFLVLKELVEIDLEKIEEVQNVEITS